ncbi:MAG: hypothetical protein Q9221_002227 [Calogaya cf. arnoldii]
MGSAAQPIESRPVREDNRREDGRHFRVLELQNLEPWIIAQRRVIASRRLSEGLTNSSIRPRGEDRESPGITPEIIEAVDAAVVYAVLPLVSFALSKNPGAFAPLWYPQIDLHPEGAGMTEVEVVKVLIVWVIVEIEVKVSVLVATAVSVEVLEKVSVTATPVCVMVASAKTLEVRVKAAPVTVRTRVEARTTSMISGESFLVEVDIGIRVLAKVVASWVKHLLDVTSLELKVWVNERAQLDCTKASAKKKMEYMMIGRDNLESVYKRVH